MQKETGKYIYCIIKNPKSFGVEFCGVGGGPLHVIHSGDLAAIVSDSPITDYPITRENTMTHQRAIEEVMQAYSSALPVSFGTVAEDGAIVGKKLLESNQSELLDALERIEGKVELNLKALWLDLPAIYQKVVAENSNLARLKKECEGRMLSIDETIEIGKLVENGLEARREKIKEEIFSLLEDIVVERKDTPLFGGFGGQMIFNMALLIPENKQKVFDKIVYDLDEKYKDENGYFKYIGPIPPFNFVKVPIRFAD